MPVSKPAFRKRQEKNLTGRLSRGNRKGRCRRSKIPQLERDFGIREIRFSQRVCMDANVSEEFFRTSLRSPVLGRVSDETDQQCTVDHGDILAQQSVGHLQARLVGAGLVPTEKRGQSTFFCRG